MVAPPVAVVGVVTQRRSTDIGEPVPRYFAPGAAGENRGVSYRANIRYSVFAPPLQPSPVAPPPPLNGRAKC
jgi:hypothetical protein